MGVATGGRGAPGKLLGDGSVHTLDWSGAARP